MWKFKREGKRYPLDEQDDGLYVDVTQGYNETLTGRRIVSLLGREVTLIPIRDWARLETDAQD